MDFAARVGRVEPSATIAVSNLASELEAGGADVVSLSVGEPDFATPEPVVAAGTAAIDAGHTGYTPAKGVPELRSAIADYLRGMGLDYDAEDTIVTPGAKHALYEAVHALVDDGDEVVLLDPAWVSYEAMVRLAGGTTTRVQLPAPEFRLEPALDDLAAAVSDDTALVVVNSPNNPSGAVYSDAALRGLRDLAVDHDVTVVSDEIYREIAYGVEPTPLATLPDMRERTVTVNGFSKAYAMTGWRLGYLAAPEAVVSEAGKVHSHSVTCATNFVQRAGVAALREAGDATTEMAAAFERRRDLLVDLLADAGVDVPAPEGAFYVLVPVDEDDQSWCERALEETHVATVPGSAFGAPGYARVSYANSDDRIREGVARLVEAGFL